MQDQIVLEAKNVSKTVASPEGRLTILADVSLSVRTGETLAIVGASGAGKSTLLALLAGLDSPSTGRVLIAGVDLTELDEDGRAAIRGKHVGFVFQSFHLIPSLTAVENVMLPLELGGRRDARQAALAALAQVGLTPRQAHYPKQLSGGEQQRVAIARAFVTHPAVLFADEPTGNLDTATGQRITDLLFDLNRSTGSTLVLVTHDRALGGTLQPRPGTRRRPHGELMQVLRFALRNLWRDLKSGELSVLLLALTVAVLSLTAVGFFTSRISQGVRAQAAEVLAADLRLESPNPIAARYFTEAQGPGLAQRANSVFSDRDIQRRCEPIGGAQRGDRELSIARPRAHRGHALRRRARHRPHTRPRRSVDRCAHHRAIENSAGNAFEDRRRDVSSDPSARLPAGSGHGLRESRARRAAQL